MLKSSVAFGGRYRDKMSIGIHVIPSTLLSEHFVMT